MSWQTTWYEAICCAFIHLCLGLVTSIGDPRHPPAPPPDHIIEQYRAKYRSLSQISLVLMYVIWISTFRNPGMAPLCLTCQYKWAEIFDGDQLLAKLPVKIITSLRAIPIFTCESRAESQGYIGGGEGGHCRDTERFLASICRAYGGNHWRDT